MHILCTICSDLVNQADNIYVTKCGHVFHYHCLSQWIERSKSCPQCRCKVTHSCMYRLFPTISNEVTGDDVATLQSRLDDAQFQLRQQKSSCKEHEGKVANLEQDLKKNLALLKATEKKLESRDTAVSAMKLQIEYLQIQNRETQSLKEENENLKKNLQTLNGLQKVLNATGDEVEQMLEVYSDVRTVATFATALKMALCEAERKKNELRDRVQALTQTNEAERNAFERMRTIYAFQEEMRNNRKMLSDDLDQSVIEDSPSRPKRMRPNLELNEGVYNTAGCSASVNTMVNEIENADSPYLQLQRSGLSLIALTRTVLQPTNPLSDKNVKPSQFPLLHSGRMPDAVKTSIFRMKEPMKFKLSQENDPNPSMSGMSYDGLGGRCKLDTFPVPSSSRASIKSRIPKLSAKHKLKNPNQPAGSQDIGKMLKKMRDK